MIVITGKNGLKAPSVYWTLTPGQIADICNRCGPKGWGWIVPDRFRFIGIDFSPACNIHDFCYHAMIPKDKADRMFLDNMLTISDREAMFGCHMIADHFAFLYYLAVKNAGAGSYNRSKGE